MRSAVRAFPNFDVHFPDSPPPSPSPSPFSQVPSIQQSAALALGRLANYSDDLAEAVVGNEILPQLVYSLSEQNRFDYFVRPTSPCRTALPFRRKITQTKTITGGP